jgi:hypothetical protein
MAKNLAQVLETNPKAAIRFIVYNNPNAVYQNLIKSGIGVSQNPENIIEAILNYGAQPQYRDAVIQSLQVPIKWANCTDEMKEALTDASVVEVASNKSVLIPEWVVDQENNQEVEESQTTWSWDWLDEFFGAIQSGFQYFGSSEIDINSPQYQEYLRQQAADKSKRTITISIIITIIIGLTIFLILKKK